ATSRQDLEPGTAARRSSSVQEYLMTRTLVRATDNYVGLAGLEPATPRPPAACSTMLSHSPSGHGTWRWLGRNTTEAEHSVGGVAECPSERHFVRPSLLCRVCVRDVELGSLLRERVRMQREVSGPRCLCDDLHV